MQGRSDDWAGLREMQRAAAEEPLLAAEEERELAQRAQRGDARAFDRLVRSHMRLVLSMAADFRRFGVPALDLVSEGMLGLVIAARRFEPERGTRLAVYAAWWIRALLRRFTLSNRRMVRASSSRDGRFVLAHLGRCERQLVQALGAPPDRETIAASLGVGVSEVEQAKLALNGRDAALGMSSADGGEAVELVSQEPSPEAIVAQAQERAAEQSRLAEALQHLEARERAIISDRHLRASPRSLAELGAGLGISRERVRQIEARGYAKLCVALRSSSASTPSARSGVARSQGLA